MAEIVNLKLFRKGKKRRQAEEQAAASRALSGRTKAERKTADSERRRLARDLDGKRLDPP